MNNPTHSAQPYTPVIEERVEVWALAKIPPKRHAHVRGVVATAAELARRYAPDDEIRARLAGWIHDSAKHWSDDELMEFALSRGIELTEGERDVPMLLHGVVGYELANDVFGFDDAQLRSACALHTTGAPGMTTLDKIVFLADLIEPGRDFPGVDALRREAARNLDSAVLHSLDHTIRYLLDKGKLIDPRAFQLRNALLRTGVKYEGSSEK